jgi:hypothetical protein
MNKVSDYRNTYEEASSKVSDITRQMALAGISIIWIFKQPDTAGKLLSKDLILPLISFGFTLTCDILQYIYKTIAWYCFYRMHEKKVDPNVDPDPPLQANIRMNRPSWILFWFKVVGLIFGYILIFIFLFHKMFI